jgi:hypothetical protein
MPKTAPFTQIIALYNYSQSDFMLMGLTIMYYASTLNKNIQICNSKSENDTQFHVALMEQILDFE